MSEDKLFKNNTKIQGNDRFFLVKRKSMRGLISMITRKIRKLRRPRIQQQFYIGPGVDWD